MEQGRTIHHARESGSEDGNIVFNPADDSSSSYEVSSASENERLGAPMIEEDLSAIRRRWRGTKNLEKPVSETPFVTSRDFVQPNSDARARAEAQYSDEWIKQDAARWAATFSGPTESDNLSQDERISNSRPQKFRNRSKKRKAERLETKKSKAKRPKGLYNDNYRQLLNEEIRNTQQSTAESNDQLPQSQIGMATWTPFEKELFFEALSRLGKDNVRCIASKTGSKSELEVQEYIQLLHEGMVEKTLNEPRRQLLGFADMPAAVQLSQECCDELEKAADALASRQNRYEEQKEQQKYGLSWLLNSEFNNWVEEQLPEESGSHPLREVLPEAGLLNLKNWLELSTRVFMNPSAPRKDENWQYLAEPGEEPALRASAFADFHRLAISITKRLVSTTIFCTMSRLRAMGPRSFNRYDIVKPADVEAAANIIGFEINSDKFWRECPRRCNLDVIKSMPTAASDQSPMHYDEVEDLLNRRRKTNQSAVRSDGEASRPALSVAASPEPSSSESSNSLPSYVSELEPKSEAEDAVMDTPARDLAFEFMEGIELEHNGPIDPSDSEFERSHNHKKQMKNITAIEALDQAHVEYTEAIDIKASLLEERRLWEILKQEPPFAIEPEKVDLPKRPRQERKGAEEIKDWRDRMEFWSQWEMLDYPVTTRAFSRPPARPANLRASTRNTTVDGSGSESKKRRKMKGEIIREEDLSNFNGSYEIDPDPSSRGDGDSTTS